MPTVFGFETNAEAQRVKYTQTGGGGYEGPAEGGWVSVGQSVPVIRVPIRSEEKVRAGVDVNTEAGKLIFNLVGGESPLSTQDTLEIDGNRFNVRSVSPYTVVGFDQVGLAEIVRA